MHVHLLDAGGAGLVFGFLIVFMIMAISVEAVVMILMKYSRAGKAFLDSFIVNMASLVAGYISLYSRGDVFVFTNSLLLNWFLLYVITWIIEGLVLYLLNRGKPVGKTLLVAAIMNIVSYLILYFFTGGF